MSLDLVWCHFTSLLLCPHTLWLIHTDSRTVHLKYTEYKQDSSHCSHPASIHNSLDGGIFSVFIVTALKILGFPGPPYPHMPANLARAKGKEMAGLGGKNLIKQIL